MVTSTPPAVRSTTLTHNVAPNRKLVSSTTAAVICAEALTVLVLCVAFATWSSNHQRIRDAAEEASKTPHYPPHDTVIGVLIALSVIVIGAALAATICLMTSSGAVRGMASAMVMMTGGFLALAVIVTIYTSVILAAPAIIAAVLTGLAARSWSAHRS